MLETYNQPTYNNLPLIGELLLAVPSRFANNIRNGAGRQESGWASARRGRCMDALNTATLLSSHRSQCVGHAGRRKYSRFIHDISDTRLPRPSTR